MDILVSTDWLAEHMGERDLRPAIIERSDALVAKAAVAGPVPTKPVDNEQQVIEDNAQALAAGVSLGRGALGTFAFNTVVGNGVTQSGIAGGVVCQTPAQLTDSIIDGNAFSTQGRSQVDSSCTLLRVALGAEGSVRPGTLPGAVSLETDYRLKDASACCIDKGQTDLGLAVDYFGGKRPQRSGFDVGAHELP